MVSKGKKLQMASSSPSNWGASDTQRRPHSSVGRGAALFRLIFSFRLARSSSTRSTSTPAKYRANVSSALNWGQSWLTRGFKGYFLSA